MTKIQRVEAALRGEAPDRPPYSFWTHLPGIDLDPMRLARETVALYRLHDLDFVKSMPNGLYAVEDWGCVCDYTDITRGGTAKVVRPAVQDIADWRRIDGLVVTRGTLGRELEHLDALVRGLEPAAPVLATVFSPLTVASKLSNGAVHEHLRSEPGAVKGALGAIAETTARFAAAAIARGCAGIFLAIQDATRAHLEEAAYREVGEPYDRQVLEAARRAGGWFNVVHMHGDDVMFDILSRYDADALNWHIGETPPTLAAYREAGGTRAVLGGLRRSNITQGDIAAVRADVEAAVAATGGRGLLLAPACVIRHPVDHDVLAAAAGMIRTLARA
jgi:uroporphyrinogen decarboxylase